VPDDDVVRAAGGIPWRRTATGELEVLVVHRPRYGDWTFPKGKLDPGEGWEQAAVREVFEEARLVTLLGAELPAIEYHDRHGRPKRVRYWAMVVAADAGFEPGDEVDERRWLPIAEADRLLTYERDRVPLSSLADAVPVPTPSSGSET
jgi:8-oxo-dGTP pyrophosphatase MutT (NUDIX family)